MQGITSHKKMLRKMQQHGKHPLPVQWDEVARLQLKKAFEYIRTDSVQNAEKVRRDILQLTRSLSEHAERYPLDKNKDNNDGTYRAVEKHKYRIAYRVLPDKVRIVRVRNTKQEPLV
jgi:plasmid stabilization system protein ParE